MAQQEPGGGSGESRPRTDNARCVQRDISETIGECSIELAQALVDASVRKGNLDSKLKMLEAEGESFHEAANAGDLNPSEYVERAEAVSETVEGLRNDAERYERAMTRVSEAYENQQSSIQPGQFVCDEREADRNSTKRMIALGRADEDASAYTFGPDRTPLAEKFPEYPADDVVIEVIYEKDALDNFGTRATPERLVELYENNGFEERGVRTYGFHESRLLIADDQSDHTR